MTGEEFEQGMKQLGYSQAQVSALLEVHRDSVAARRKAPVVDGLYRYAMLGMLAEQAFHAQATAKAAQELVERFMVQKG